VQINALAPIPKFLADDPLGEEIGRHDLHFVRP
jgi:hypothetical protein